MTLKLPYVIDNQTHRMADLLREILEQRAGQSLDVATAYFTVGGFGEVKAGLEKLGSFRLLLGAEPQGGEAVGLKPDPLAVKGLLRRDLEMQPFSETMLRLIEDLIAYLRRESVKVRLHHEGFLHAKAWIFYSDKPGQQGLFDRFRPVLAVVGSSNFTYPGLTSNRELNLVHKVLLDPTEAGDKKAAEAVRWLTEETASEAITDQNRQLLKSEVGARAIIDLEEWYERQWKDARDFKDELVELLQASKFGENHYTPYQVFLKALYEYFKGDLEDEFLPGTRSAVELAEFQKDAVRRARKILSIHDGVMVCDSVGLGKTWIGKRLLEDYAYHKRQKALVICPASLREMWEGELKASTIAASVRSQEEIAQEGFDLSEWMDSDVVVVDESHNFRNPDAQRSEALERIIAGNGRRGRDGGRKKVILLTATPINNDLLDLYNQLLFITGNNRSFFAPAGIGDLKRYFLNARKAAKDGSAIGLVNLLEEIVIRRTRGHIKKAYPEATVRGKKVSFPDRKLHTVEYNLEKTYPGIYEKVVGGIESLKLAPYQLESYKKAEAKVDDFEKGREQALVGIFKSRYLKRFESSVEAFRISVKRALWFIKTFESYLMGGKLLDSRAFQKVLQIMEIGQDSEDLPRSMHKEIDENKEAKAIIETLPMVNLEDYEKSKLYDDLEADKDVLTGLWEHVKDLKPEDDLKLQELKSRLKGPLKGKKVLIFSYYKDTARYLYEQLGHPESKAAAKFIKEIGGANIRRMDSGADAKERVRIVQAFAPKANEKPELVGTDKEIDILISTDVLSEGQNLQDCGNLINYDLHWNPTRMVQRAGRIDRLGTDFDTLSIYNMFPDEGLERLLQLVSRLSERISQINELGLLDASVLGEAVNPKDFNTLKRIRKGDDKVFDEEEAKSDLATTEGLQQQLRNFLDRGGKGEIEELPDGIHSGLQKGTAKGVFFYFKAEPETGNPLHFWRYYDLLADRMQDNRLVIGDLISCAEDTPRLVDPALKEKVFDYQEKAITSILEGFEQQQAIEEAPTTVDPIQSTVRAALQPLLNHPKFKRDRVAEAIKFLGIPVTRSFVRRLRELSDAYQRKNDGEALLAGIEGIRADVGGGQATAGAQSIKKIRLTREDLRLVCFDFLNG